MGDELYIGETHVLSTAAIANKLRAFKHLAVDHYSFFSVMRFDGRFVHRGNVRVLITSELVVNQLKYGNIFHGPCIVVLPQFSHHFTTQKMWGQ